MKLCSWIFIQFSCLLLTTGPAVSSAAEFKATPPGYVGMHIHRSDLGTKWPNVSFGSWRLWDAYVSWPQLEPSKGAWDFSRLDRYVAMAKIQNVEILLPLGLTPQWASARPNEKSGYSPGFAAEPNDVEDWRRYVRTVATRYRGRIYQYEIWNEVNIPGFYSGTTEALAKLTCEAGKILKEVDPQNILVSPSIVGTGKHLEWHTKLLENGITDCVDAIGHHFYVPKTQPEAMIEDIRNVRRVLQKNGAHHLPLWNTEAGWWIENTDGTPETGIDKTWKRVSAIDSAGIIARALIIGRSAGLERYFLYAWDNKGMGFIEPSTQALKPAASAIGDVAQWLRDWNLGSCRPQKEIWVCELVSNSGQRAWIVWTEIGSSKWIPPINLSEWWAVEAGKGYLQPKKGSGAIYVTDHPILVHSLN